MDLPELSDKIILALADLFCYLYFYIPQRSTEASCVALLFWYHECVAVWFLSLGWWMADKCSKRSSLFQSKFCITSSRSTSGCRSGDTLTASTNMWTAALPWICRTFRVDRPSQVTSPGCLWKETLLNGWQLFFFFFCPSSGCHIFAFTALTRKDKGSESPLLSCHSLACCFSCHSHGPVVKRAD